MLILYAISILTFFAVLWAALAFARHIKSKSYSKSEQQKLSIVPRQTEFRQHLYSAAVTETPQIRHNDLHQSVRDITANKSWNMPPKSTQAKRSVVQLPRIGSPSRQSTRKPPQAARHGAMAFIDPAYFNKDSGDLTDPYQPPRIRSNEARETISSRRY